MTGVVHWQRRDDPAPGAVVLTTGTFLTGLIHIGETRIPAGRMGERAQPRPVQDPGALWHFPWAG